jgi:hypothetical protein
MSDQELMTATVAIAKALAYEAAPNKVAFLQGRLQMALEIMEARGIKWTC